MKKLVSFFIFFGLAGCTTYSPELVYKEQYSKFEPFAAVSIAPGMSLQLNPNCFQGTGCEYDLRFYCDSKDSSESAKECAISKCQEFYNIKNDPNWKSEDNLTCLAYDLGEGSYVSSNPYFYARLRLNKNYNDINVAEYRKASTKNNISYVNSVELARSNKIKNQIYRENARKQAQIDAEKRRKEQLFAQLTAYIEEKKMICKAYGFKEENAIATCVQTEINNEIMRMQQVQANTNAQARANAAQRSNALSNMGRCLSTEGNFGACANAWQGYTPPKVTNCQYDVFGNVIRSTCKTQ